MKIQFEVEENKDEIEIDCYLCFRPKCELIGTFLGNMKHGVVIIGMHKACAEPYIVDSNAPSIEGADPDCTYCGGSGVYDPCPHCIS